MGVKAKASRVGPNLVLIETELGQKCVIPEHSLCDFLLRYDIEVTEGVKVKCDSKTVKPLT